MNRIHPSAIIGDGVELGDGNVIAPFAVLVGPLVIGDGNWIGPHVVIGTPAEIRGIEHGAGWDDEPVGTGVRLGSANIVREYTTIHQGHYARTIVGDRNYLMNKTYLAHDNVIGDDITTASSVTLAGHVHIGSGANLGMGALVHQFRVVGPGTMVGMGAVVTKDLPPYALAFGNPCHVRGANRVGMARSGIAAEVVAGLDAAYREGREPGMGDLPDEMHSAWTWWTGQTIHEIGWQR